MLHTGPLISKQERAGVTGQLCRLFSVLRWGTCAKCNNLGMHICIIWVLFSWLNCSVFDFEAVISKGKFLRSEGKLSVIRFKWSRSRCSVCFEMFKRPLMFKKSTNTLKKAQANTSTFSVSRTVILFLFWLSVSLLSFWALWTPRRTVSSFYTLVPFVRSADRVKVLCCVFTV